ncbi:transmembrane protein 272 [Biomphalaria pfeifferi]|uniref:Transmembrane protein 272 n=1 Tax=Biomphalaria pfeifferi TaxID=112525 RepID=A0AAD8C4W3_BIOPF|nr:transmembrane protein 272 [Biomphalaria pfeifferi]
MSISKGPTDGNFKGSFVDIPLAKRESIVLRIRTAKSNTTGTKDFVSSVLLIIMQNIFFTLIVGLSLALPISKVVMGAIHFKDCPTEPLIAIYLIVSGSVATGFDLIIIVIRLNVTSKETYHRNYHVLNLFFCLSTLINFGLLVFGCVVVFPPLAHFSYDSTQPNYCNPFLYWFAFWILILHLLLYAVGLVSCVCITCMVVVSPTDPNTTIEITKREHLEAPDGNRRLESIVEVAEYRTSYKEDTKA